MQPVISRAPAGSVTLRIESEPEEEPRVVGGVSVHRRG
jgi:hypothetical protein